MSIADSKKLYENAKKYKFEGHDLSFKDYHNLLKENAKKNLLNWIDGCVKDPNDKPIVYCVLRKVSSSGMSRIIDLFVINKETGKPSMIGSATARLLQYTYKSTQLGDGIAVNGCGMDMGFSIVSNLSYALYKDDYKLEHKWL